MMARSTPETITKQSILAVPLDEPERLFSAPANIAQEFHVLAKRWHPDLCGESDAGTIFDHIKALRDVATGRAANGTWQPPGLLVVRDKKGGIQHQFRYIARRKFELGTAFIGGAAVAYMVERQYAAQFETYQRMARGFRFPNDLVRREVKRYLPVVEGTAVTETHDVLFVSRNPDLILANDLLAHLGGKIDPRHVAWIMSTLHNLCCYFQVSGITNNAITLGTYFIDPRTHSAALLGGWWYGAAEGARLVALPKAVAAVAPRDILANKLASRRLDLELIRLLGRQLLGDRAGAGTGISKETPAPMAAWLKLASSGDAVADYRAWQKVLTDSFGIRRFVKMETKPSDIYR